MAKQAKAKETASKGKSKSARHSERTKANKLRRAETRSRRLTRAAERRVSRDVINPETGKRVKPGTRFFRQCVEARERAHERIMARRLRRDRWKGMKKGERRAATETGEIQFGEKAKGYHLHQRINRLARALTPKEFQELEERKQRQEQLEQNRKLIALKG